MDGIQNVESTEGKAKSSLTERHAFLAVLLVAVFLAGMATIIWVLGYVSATEARHQADLAVQSSLSEICFWEFSRTIWTDSEGSQKQRELYLAKDRQERRIKFIQMISRTQAYLFPGPDVKLDYIEPCMEKFLRRDYTKLRDPRGIH